MTDVPLSTQEHCAACAIYETTERGAISEMALGIGGSAGFDGAIPCVRHFSRLAGEIDDAAIRRRLIEQHAEAYDDVGHDMRRYVVYLDGARSDLAAAAERTADQRGLATLAGSRALNGLTRSW